MTGSAGLEKDLPNRLGFELSMVLCQVTKNKTKTKPLLLSVWWVTSVISKSDEIKKEQASQRWMDEGCYFFFFFFSSRCAERNRRFRALHCVCSYFDTALGKAWQEKNQLSLQTLIFFVNATTGISKPQFVVDFSQNFCREKL